MPMAPILGRCGSFTDHGGRRKWLREEKFGVNHAHIHVYRGLQWRHIHFPECRDVSASSVASLVAIIRFFCHSSAQCARRPDVAARLIGRHSDAGGFSAERLVCQRGIAAQIVFDSHHRDESEMMTRPNDALLGTEQNIVVLWSIGPVALQLILKEKEV